MPCSDEAKTQLEQSSGTIDKLKAEIDRLQHHAAENSRLKVKVARCEDMVVQMTTENDRLNKIMAISEKVAAKSPTGVTLSSLSLKQTQKVSSIIETVADRATAHEAATALHAVESALLDAQNRAKVLEKQLIQQQKANLRQSKLSAEREAKLSESAEELERALANLAAEATPRESSDEATMSKVGKNMPDSEVGRHLPQAITALKTSESVADVEKYKSVAQRCNEETRVHKHTVAELEARLAGLQDETAKNIRHAMAAVTAAQQEAFDQNKRFKEEIQRVKHETIKETMLKCAAEAVAREAEKDEQESEELIRMERKLRAMRRDRQETAVRLMNISVNRWMTHKKLRATLQRWRERSFDCLEYARDAVDVVHAAAEVESLLSPQHAMQAAHEDSLDPVEAALLLWNSGSIEPPSPRAGRAQSPQGSLIESEADFIHQTQEKFSQLRSELSREKRWVQQLTRELREEKKAHAGKAEEMRRVASKTRKCGRGC